MYDVFMIRTQMNLTEDIRQNIKLFAKRENKSESQVAREIMEIGIKAKTRKRGNAGEALLRLAELGERLEINLPSDVSINHDKYLYDE